MTTMLTTVVVSCWLLTEVQARAAHHATTHENGETIVRSFIPIGGQANFMKMANKEFLFFNISMIGADEEISKAHLHLHRRRMSKFSSRSRDPQLLPPPCRVLLYQARSLDSRPRRLASLPVSPHTPGGWMPLDIAAALREIHGRSLLLGIRFEGPKSVRLTVGNFLRPAKSKKSNNTLPAYLIVFSKPDLEEGLGELRERHLKHKERKIDENEMSNDVKITASEVCHHSKHKVYEVKRSKEAALALQQRTQLQSLPFLHTNEVADMRRSLRKVKRSISGLSRHSHKQRNEISDNASAHQKESGKEKSREGCRRKLIEIPFRDGWVLSPSSYTTNVCHGSCYLHDSILFENSTRGQKGCCKPGRRSPLTMVIADGGHNLELHKLPGAVIEDCICAPCT